jgi:hypothetical protein
MSLFRLSPDFKLAFPPFSSGCSPQSAMAYFKSGYGVNGRHCQTKNFSLYKILKIALHSIFVVRDIACTTGGYKEMSSILADQLRPRI